MKLADLLVAVILLPFAIAHHVITQFLVDDIRQNNVLRQPGSLDPITDVTSLNLACGYPPGDGQGIKGTDKAVIQSGSKLTFEWHTNWSGSVGGPDGVTDDSHKGPCAIYMRKVSNAVTADANDPKKPGWFKIWEYSVDETGKFCTTRMRENGGFFSGTVPKHLANGDYLIRAETLTLNNAAEPNRQPQWYVGCAQVTLKNSEAPFVDPSTVSIPSSEYANLNMPGVRYNVWYPIRDDFSDYGPVPGPLVFYDGSANLDWDMEDEGSTEDDDNDESGDDQIVSTPISLPTITRFFTISTSHPTTIIADDDGERPKSTFSLGDGFSTIPWPSSSSLITSTSTTTVTVRPTIRTTSTIFVTVTRSPTTPTEVSVQDSTTTGTPTISSSSSSSSSPAPTIWSTRTHTKTVVKTNIVTKTIIRSKAQPSNPGIVTSNPPQITVSDTPAKVATITRYFSVTKTVTVHRYRRRDVSEIPTNEPVATNAKDGTAEVTAKPTKYYHWHRIHRGGFFRPV